MITVFGDQVPYMPVWSWITDVGGIYLYGVGFGIAPDWIHPARDFKFPSKTSTCSAYVQLACDRDYDTR